MRHDVSGSSVVTYFGHDGDEYFEGAFGLPFLLLILSNKIFVVSIILRNFAPSNKDIAIYKNF